MKKFEAKKGRKFRLVALVTAAVLLCGTLAACGDETDTTDPSSDTSGKSGEVSSTFSWWLYQGTDSSYYSTYRQNPGVEYLLSKTYGPDEHKLDFEFIVPVSGAEKDNFNTLLNTGEYADVLAMAAYTGSIMDLYEDGIILDLTEYVDKYMPTYKYYVESDPLFAQEALHIIGGEKKYIQLLGYGDAPEINWEGYQYRRDWIVKYGKNPVDGSAFSGSCLEQNADGTPNTDTWVDNVVFPSGGYDPIYISDWEWMFEIFTRAIEDQNITDGYCMSLSFPGYVGMGDLVCSFGGGGSMWYRTPDGQVKFGGTDDEFRVYLQCVNTWYENGWIDKAFTEHTADIFYRIDDTKVRQGKVGLWQGVYSQLLGRLGDGGGFTEGMISFAAPQPINDIYGSDEHKNKIPYTMYQQSRISGCITISDKAKEKDLAALFSFLDYLYTPEGGRIMMMGLSKEQYEEVKPAFYTEQGLTEGAYYRIPDEDVVDGHIYAYVDKIQNDTGTLQQAAAAVRLTGFDQTTLRQQSGSKQLLENYAQWLKYENTGWLGTNINGHLTAANDKIRAKTETNCTDFMAKNVPQFVKGTKDPFSDGDWDAYVNALNKYSPDKVSGLYQELLDSLK